VGCGVNEAAGINAQKNSKQDVKSTYKTDTFNPSGLRGFVGKSFKAPHIPQVVSINAFIEQSAG
jgi:hypothetical protein